jgi:hypothetical protein
LQRCGNAVLRDQTGLHQRGQIGRQGRWLDIQRLRQLARWHAVGIAPHQQAEQGQPLGMAKGRQADADVCFHISRIYEI